MSSNFTVDSVLNKKHKSRDRV